MAMDRIGSFLNAGIAGSQVTPLKLLVVITLLVVLVWATRRTTHWFVDHVLARRGVDVGLREALGAITRYGVIGLGTLVILQAAGINLTSLNVLVGAFGVGLGFGLQNITSNFFSGLILLLERPIRIGDRVEIAGAVGEVREIAARATTLITDDNVAVIVPNSQFISERVINWSRPNALTSYVLTFHVAQGSDPELVRRLLLAAAEGHQRVLRSPAPEVEFERVGLRGLQFRLQVWSREDLKSAGTLRSDLNFAVWKQLATSGIPTAAEGTVGVRIAERGRAEH
jgi:small-conductance mechanosensitive channel